MDIAVNPPLSRLQQDFIRLKENAAIDPRTVALAKEVVRLLASSGDYCNAAGLSTDEDGCCLEWPQLSLFCHFEVAEEDGSQVAIWVHRCVNGVPSSFHYPPTPRAAATTLKMIIGKPRNAGLGYGYATIPLVAVGLCAQMYHYPTTSILVILVIALAVVAIYSRHAETK